MKNKYDVKIAKKRLKELMQKPSVLEQSKITNDLIDRVTLTREIDCRVMNRQREKKVLASPHEGWAKIQEEVDELWELVKMKSADRNPKKMREEALQIATRAICFALDLCR